MRPDPYKQFLDLYHERVASGGRCCSVYEILPDGNLGPEQPCENKGGACPCRGCDHGRTNLREGRLEGA